jgi:hypothetical protein
MTNVDRKTRIIKAMQRFMESQQPKSARIKAQKKEGKGDSKK